MLERCSLWKSSETIDDMKFESSSDADSSSQNVYSSKSFLKNTEFSYGDDFCVVRRIKVYIRGTGRYISLKSKDSFLIVSKQ